MTRRGSAEHHSASTPEIFIATAAERTRHIKLGTGVVSLPYHNPLWAVERIVLLDHLTRGRIMFGVGPCWSAAASVTTTYSMCRRRLRNTSSMAAPAFALR